MYWTKEIFLTLLLATFVNSDNKTVRFELPSSSSTSRTSFSSQQSSDSTNSSSDESVEYVDSKASTFKRLRVDDDKITARSSKNKNKKDKTKHGLTKKPSGSHNNWARGLLKSWNRRDQEAEFDDSGPIFTHYWREIVEQDENNKIGLNGAKSLDSNLTGLMRSIETVKNPLNAGWLLFSFPAGSSQTSATNYKFISDQPVRITLVDLFCRGDSFSIWDNGQLVAQSSRALADVECEDRIISPFEAMQDGRWSSVVFELRSGEHSLIVKTVDSPFESEGGGVAAIKFEKLIQPRRVSRNKVCRGFNGLIVVKTSVPVEEAESVCLGLKTDLAQVETSSIAMNKSVKECSGSSGSVWALDGKGEVALIVLSSGSEAEFNYESRNEEFEVLCQVR